MTVDRKSMAVPSMSMSMAVPSMSMSIAVPSMSMAVLRARRPVRRGRRTGRLKST